MVKTEAEARKDNFPGSLPDGAKGTAGNLVLAKEVRKAFLEEPRPKDLGAAASRIDAVPKQLEKINKEKFYKKFGPWLKRSLFDSKDRTGNWIYVFGLNKDGSKIEIKDNNSWKKVDWGELEVLLQAYRFDEKGEDISLVEKKSVLVRKKERKKTSGTKSTKKMSSDNKESDSKIDLQIAKIKKQIEEIIQKSRDDKNFKVRDVATSESESYDYSSGSKKILNVDEEIAHLEGEIKKLEAQKSNYAEKVKKAEESRKLRKDSGIEDGKVKVTPEKKPLKLVEEPERIIPVPVPEIEPEIILAPENIPVNSKPVPIPKPESEIKPEIKDQKEQTLVSELDKLRKDYTRINSTCSEELGKVGSIIGRFLKTKPTNIGEIEEAFNLYNAKKHELLDFKIEELKKMNLSPEELRKEMGALVRYFNVDEWANLKRDNDYSKLEKWNNLFGERSVDTAKKVVNWYRKLPLKYKFLATGVVIGLGLTGVTTGAGLLSGAITVGVAARKILASVASGVGTSAMLENFYRKKEEKNINARSGEIMEQYDLAEADKKMESIVSELELEMESFQNKLKTENEKAKKRALMGWVAFAGAMGLSSVTWFSGGHAEIPKTGGYDWNNMTPEQIKVALGLTGKAGETLAEHGADAGKVMTGAVKEKMADALGKILEVEPGSSLEGTLIDHLEKLGMNPAEAGKEAHVMALNYAREHGISDKGPYSLIHKGAKLIMSEDGKHLLGIEGDDKLGWFKPEGGFELEKNIPQAGLKEVIDSVKEGIKEGAGINATENLVNATDNATDTVIQEALNNSDNATASIANSSEAHSDWKDFSLGAASVAGATATAFAAKELGNTFNKIREKMLPDNFDWRGKRTIQFLSGKDKDRWKTISHWTARDVQFKLPEKNYKRILKVIDKYKKIIGDSANPLPGEKVIQWVARIVDESMKKNTKQIKF